MPLHSSLVPSALAFALAVALPTPSWAQEKPANLYIDVATHAMPGMPGLGAMGRLSGAMSGGGASYGLTQHPAMPGKFMDVALHNGRQPGRPAEQAVPHGLGLGNRIDLLPPPDRKPVHDGNDGGLGTGIADGNGTFKIRYYWGCGEATGAGQPREYSVTIRNGKMVESGRGITPRKVPGRAVTPGPDHALWPNQSTRKTVPAKASLVGQHHVTGDKVPASMQFALAGEHDFLSELKLKGDGGGENGMTLRWSGADGANGYFAHATVTSGDTIVMWSSSEDGYAGYELLDYLPESLVAKWVKARTLLAPDARECHIPKAVFAGGKAAPMVQMIAYGNDRNVVEPRPQGAAQNWKPDWAVRVRSKSTAMLMPGLGALGTEATGRSTGEEIKEEAKSGVKDAAKGLLRGLLRR
ncbi:hypothetical protein [Luteimonas cucumeris]|nr:hypothetical protein [Luteimonas cucumeris]